jgi:hypothetical protein
MTIHTKVVFQWDDTLSRYNKVSDEYFEYNGPIDLVCGASAAQNQILGQQTGFASQVANQAGTIFGNASSAFNALQASLLPTISKGPNQMAFSQGELAARNAGVISTGGQAAANAKSAIGNANAAQGGGNTSLTSGATSAEGANAVSDIAANTATELNKVQQEGYVAGQNEYNEAIKGEEGATNVFNPASEAANAGTTAFNGAANTANEVTEQNQSWVNAAIGALGNVAGAATGGLMKGVGGMAGNAIGVLNNAQHPTNQGSMSTISSIGSGDQIPQQSMQNYQF